MMKTEIEEIKDIQSKHLQIKNTIAEMKNTLNELPSYQTLQEKIMNYKIQQQKLPKMSPGKEKL